MTIKIIKAEGHDNVEEEKKYLGKTIKGVTEYTGFFLKINGDDYELFHKDCCEVIHEDGGK